MDPFTILVLIFVVLVYYPQWLSAAGGVIGRAFAIWYVARSVNRRDDSQHAQLPADNP